MIYFKDSIVKNLRQVEISFDEAQSVMLTKRALKESSIKKKLNDFSKLLGAKAHDIGEDIGSSNKEFIENSWMIPLDKNNLKGLDLSQVLHLCSLLGKTKYIVEYSYKLEKRTGIRVYKQDREDELYTSVAIIIKYKCKNPRGSIRRFFGF
ncbi:hypothetical protein [Aliivibrio fischeri]|uniref:hypothetical protein n=1 Tax=Aliivibrio fischeri TaxID=668 RepID=UPI0012DA1EC0|nr:hypothetical protein [Aliivibrio fischeri]MUK70157.1 hypothetical protein [Aliivibrio fischeri]MUK72691.1 hypothetical protein [Aliivibrio fischeri]